MNQQLLTIKKCLLMLGASLCLTTTNQAISAESSSYPNQSIRIIVPYSAGTGSDAIARVVAQAITEKHGHSIIIENRDGAGSLIGTTAAAQAAPDGYTFLIVANPFVIVPAQRTNRPYDPLKDFVPVAKVATIPLVLAAAPNLPIKNVQELVEYAKANPGKLNYASSGPGTISQQEMEIFKQVADLDITEVGYKSTAQAMTDLLGNHISLFPVVVPLVEQHLRAGKAQGVAIFDQKPSPLFPDIPPINEQLGVADYIPTPVWYGFVAPKDTPEDIVTTMNQFITEAMQDSKVNKHLAAAGAQPITRTNEEFTAELKAEFEKAAQLAKQLGTAR